ncbi:MAG: NUDIX hydrolase [Longimicrobiales bacterium]
MPRGTIDALRQTLCARTPRVAERAATTGEAAVALVLRERDPLELLLIHRVDRPDDPWAGHMAFPGGGRQHDDADLLATALRETREEVDLRIDRALDVLGPLDEIAPMSPRLPPLVIAPFVVRIDHDAEPVPDPREVQAAIWIPLPALRDDAAIGEVLIELEGGPRSFPAFLYQEYEIWGLTQRILRQLLDLV